MLLKLEFLLIFVLFVVVCGSPLSSNHETNIDFQVQGDLKPHDYIIYSVATGGSVRAIERDYPLEVAKTRSLPDREIWRVFTTDDMLRIMANSWTDTEASVIPKQGYLVTSRRVGLFPGDWERAFKVQPAPHFNEFFITVPANGRWLYWTVKNSAIKLDYHYGQDAEVYQRFRLRKVDKQVFCHANGTEEVEYKLLDQTV